VRSGTEAGEVENAYALEGQRRFALHSVAFSVVTGVDITPAGGTEGRPPA
jgi:hypothetical protein